MRGLLDRLANEPHLKAEIVRAVVIVAGLVGVTVSDEQVAAVILLLTLAASVVATVRATKRSYGPQTYHRDVKDSFERGRLHEAARPKNRRR